MILLLCRDAVGVFSSPSRMDREQSKQDIPICIAPKWKSNRLSRKLLQKGLYNIVCSFQRRRDLTITAWDHEIWYWNSRIRKVKNFNWCFYIRIFIAMYLRITFIYIFYKQNYICKYLQIFNLLSTKKNVLLSWTMYH